jgi:hypothetical protein
MSQIYQTQKRSGLIKIQGLEFVTLELEESVVIQGDSNQFMKSGN